MGKAQKLKEQKKLEKVIQEEDKQKKRKKRNTLSFFIILVLIIAIGLIFYFSYSGKEKSIIRVVIETNKGDIELELYKDIASKTVENFIKLTNEEFYNGIKFHRVVENFIIQGGDPLSKDDDPLNDGAGGPGYTFEDEINPESLGLSDETIKSLEAEGYIFNYNLKSIPHEVGVISMANSGPNTNGSQFFIITAEAQPHLNGRHTVFGKVIEGMGVVQEIEQGDIMKKVEIINK